MNKMPFIRKNNLQTGDRLVVLKAPGINHHGIFVNDGMGRGLVAENRPQMGVQYSTSRDFLHRAIGARIDIQAFAGSEADRAKIIPRIDALLGTGYDLLRFNCEHFANEIQQGKATSYQIGGWMAALTFLGIAWMITRESE